MPSVLIEVRKQYTQADEIALMEAVHKSLRDTFKILSGDRNVRLVVHEPHRFACPPDREKPEFYTHISIDAFAGRSLDAKRSLYKAIVNNLEPFGIPKNHVKYCYVKSRKRIGASAAAKQAVMLSWDSKLRYSEMRSNNTINADAGYGERWMT